MVPGWLGNHGTLFEWLLHHATWRQRRRKMWDNEVMEPRLTTGWKERDFPAPIALLAAPLNEAYAVTFDSCLINLYRDGSDAVAWHGDTVRKVLRNPLVVTVSLGARRPFLVKPVAGGHIARRYAPGEGDLLVMGGAMQHDWLHTVPRQKSVCGARMSITLRHSQPYQLPHQRAPDQVPRERTPALPRHVEVL